MLRTFLTRVLPLCVLLLPFLPLSNEIARDVGLPTTPTASAQDVTADPPPESKKESYLGWLYNALGLRYVISFLFISFVFVAVLVMNLLSARRDAVCPATLVEAFEAHLNEKRYQEAYELAKNDESFLGKVLSAGLSKLSKGYPQAVEAMQEVGEDENMKIEHRLSYLALIGTIAPMVGLLGTVDGMIMSFEVIAKSTSSPKPSQLASGISMAMVTTLVGLVLAIPAITVFNLLKNRFARMVLEVGIIGEGLMSRFESVNTPK